MTDINVIKLLDANNGGELIKKFDINKVDIEKFIWSDEDKNASNDEIIKKIKEKGEIEVLEYNFEATKKNGYRVQSVGGLTLFIPEDAILDNE